MRIFFNERPERDGTLRMPRPRYAGAALIACLAFVSCAKIAEIGQGPAPEKVSHTPVVNTPVNFEVALKENQAALKGGKIAADVALFNSGVILAHPSNPKADYPKAIVSFKTLVAEHSRSNLVSQAKTWIQVLEQQQKLSEEKQKVLEQQQKVSEEKHKLAEEKRILAREREMLLQERQKLNYANEKSRQLDLEIEKRRRQSLR